MAMSGKPNPGWSRTSPSLIGSDTLGVLDDQASDATRSEVTAIFQRVAAGDANAAEDLLPLVYDELKALARARMRQSQPDQTLQATALVHEAWLKLGGNEQTAWNSRAHFFGAAARAMRDVLVDAARRRNRRGGDRREPLGDHIEAPDGGPNLDVLALDEALERFESEHPEAARVVMLRFFAGLTIPEAAELLGISGRTADREWAFARAWFGRALRA
tara:strand:- start:6722 stop:7372 length:651 start_codon:yes stop_codon:yes gene_type:complete